MGKSLREFAIGGGQSFQDWHGLLRSWWWRSVCGTVEACPGAKSSPSPHGIQCIWGFLLGAIYATIRGINRCQTVRFPRISGRLPVMFSGDTLKFARLARNSLWVSVPENGPDEMDHSRHGSTDSNSNPLEIDSEEDAFGLIRNETAKT